MYNNYSTQEKELFNYYLDNDAFPIPNNDKILNINKHGLELIVRPNCNQTCEYCYIYQHGNELYPDNHFSKEEQLKHIQLILDWIFFERRNYFYKIELFAGDLFYDEIFIDFLNLYETYLKQFKKEYDYIFKIRSTIIIPSNMRFVVEKPEIAKKVKEFHDYFLKEYNLKIAFSWSSDGPYGTFERERIELDDSYFDQIFKYCFSMDAGYHPMTSAHNVFFLKDNYDWWLKKMKEFAPEDTDYRYCDFAPSFLEVRNGKSWTEESIQAYLDFLTYAMEKRYEICGSNIEMLTEHFFASDLAQQHNLPRTTGYDHLSLNYFEDNMKQIESYSCGLQSEIHINCINMSFVPCHRTAYPLFTGAYFILSNDNSKIIDIKVNNFSTYYTLKTASIQNVPVCNICEYKNLCIKGCPGAQYEDSGELFLPIPSVCNLFRKKLDHLIKLYNDYNILQNAIDKKFITGKAKDFFIKKSKELGYDLYE